MITNRISPSTSKPKPELPPLAPGLKRVESLPAQLPSHPPRDTQVNPARKPITRAKPDAHPPVNYSRPPIKPPKVCGLSFQTKKQKQEMKLMEERRIREGAERKVHALKEVTDSKGYKPNILGDSEYMDVIKAYHPKFDEYSGEQKLNAIQMLQNNPRFVAGMAQSRNEVSWLPNGPTATRKMEPDEQTFLTNAFNRLKGEFEDPEKRFRIHGETGIVGNKNGEVVVFRYNPAGSIHTPIVEGNKYHLHTHPPLGEPFDSSASCTDQRLAARFYLLHDNKMMTYVTNGRDVLHIQPDSTELVKLMPDAKVEKKLGKFPVAFRLPTPQGPPYPFANHEAPAGVKMWTPPVKPPIPEEEAGG